ncbi:MFS transporter [Phytoactinopolyspora halophila]|nr:MFS transporter [Phytoactinopolyspora halophila]
MKTQLVARRRLVFAIICLTQFFMIVNSTIVVIALPPIQRDLGFGVEGLTWVVNSYLLVFGGFLLLGGRIADIFGRKQVFLIGVSVYTVASLFAGLATTAEILLAARSLQGLGAAVVIPTTLSILLASFPPGPERRRALSIWAAFNFTGASVSLFVGGLLTHTLSWSAIFLVNVPVGLIVVAAAARWMPMWTRISGSIDLGGALLVTSGSVLLVYAVLNARQESWISPTTLAAGIVAVILLGTLTLVEHFHSAPLITPSIFRERTLTIAVVTLPIMAGGVMAVGVLMTLYFQNIREYSPLQTGMAFLAPTGMVVIGSLTTNHMLRWLGAGIVAPAALFLIAAGTILLTRVGPNSEYVTVALPGLSVMNLGVGYGSVTLIGLATAKLPNTDTGLVSGLVRAAEQIGGALGIAVYSSAAAVGTASSAAPTHSGTAIVNGYQFAFWCVAAVIICWCLFLMVALRKPHQSLLR